MKKIILTFGLIAGSIVAVLMIITMSFWESGVVNFDNGELVGYTGMVVALSMIFFGIKSYRDQHGRGVITFGKGVKIGLLITLIAAVMYSLAWEICYNTVASGFTEKMQAHYFAELESQGMSPEKLEKAKQDWQTFSEYYKNPVIRFFVTMVEILPVGIIITLLGAGILRKQEVLPTTPV